MSTIAVVVAVPVPVIVAVVVVAVGPVVLVGVVGVGGGGELVTAEVSVGAVVSIGAVVADAVAAGSTGALEVVVVVVVLFVVLFEVLFVVVVVVSAAARSPSAMLGEQPGAATSARRTAARHTLPRAVMPRAHLICVSIGGSPPDLKPIPARWPLRTVEPDEGVNDQLWRCRRSTVVRFGVDVRWEHMYDRGYSDLPSTDSGPPTDSTHEGCLVMAAATDQSSETDAETIDPARGAAGARAGAGGCKVGDLHAAVAMLVEVDLASCTHADLDVLRGATQRLRSFVAAVDVRISRRNDELWAAPVGGDDDGEGDGNGSGGNDAGENGSGSGPGSGPGVNDGDGDRRSADEIARDRDRARVGELMRSFEAALASGGIDVGHVDALVVAVKRLDDDEVLAEFSAHEALLLGYARVESPERFRRRCHDLVRRLLRDHGIRESERQRAAASLQQWWNNKDGMGHLHLKLDLDRYAQLEAAINAKVDELRARSECAEMSFDQLRINAFMELATASTAAGVRPAEVSVLIDVDTLRTGVFGTSSVSETESGLPLTPAAVRRLACDGGIIPVVMGGDGVPLDVGRKRRLATKEQRLALRAMYATCSHPQCSRPFSWCRIHHIVWWELFGATDLDNLIPLCDQHHHLVHEGGWTLTMTPDRVTTWRTPGGDIWFVGDTRDTAPPTWNRPARPAPPAGTATAGTATKGAPTGAAPTKGAGTGGAPTGGAPTGGKSMCGPSNGSAAGHRKRDQDPGHGAETAIPQHLRRRRRTRGTGTSPTLFAHDIESAGP